MSSENLKKVRAKIELACKRAGRNPNDVKLVAVTKEASLNDIIEAIRAGVTDIGESKVQDAINKYITLKEYKIRWHMIGHLQTNKVKDAIKIFDLIHSVDSARLAQAIDKEAKKNKKLIDILIEINTSGEKSKFGVPEKEAPRLVEQVVNLPNTRLLGFMTIAPVVSEPEEVRPYFRRLKNLYDDVKNKFPALRLEYLSMGMSQDFEVAIEEGANIVRIGTAIFKGN